MEKRGWLREWGKEGRGKAGEEGWQVSPRAQPAGRARCRRIPAVDALPRRAWGGGGRAGASGYVLVYTVVYGQII